MVSLGVNRSRSLNMAHQFSMVKEKSIIALSNNFTVLLQLTVNFQHFLSTKEGSIQVRRK